MTHQNEPTLGPDQILPANSYTTTKPDGTIILRITKGDFGSRKPISLYSLFKYIATKYGENLALSVKRGGIWLSWTYSQYFEEANVLATAFLKLGLERFHGVCIMGFNSPEWFIAYYAAVFAGGLAAGIYTTNSPEACRHLAENCKAQIILVENEECLNKFLSIKRFLPHVKAIIQWSGKAQVGVISWMEVMAIGKLESDKLLKERLSLQAVNQCCAIIYTSGTTGPPKGVMISQDHCTWVSSVLMEIYNFVFGKEVCLSYLPLSHVAGQFFEMHGPMSTAAAIYFADPSALKGTLGETIREVQPTGFMGVPRVWEKIYEKMQEVAIQSGPVKRAVGTWAKYHSLNYYNAMENNQSLTSAEKLKNYTANILIQKIKKAMGFNRCKIFITGAAPLSRDIIDYFKSIGIPIMDCYGMSENIAMATINHCSPGNFRVGSVGKAVPSVSFKLLGVGLHAPGEGEVCMSGRNICMGYLHMPEATKAAIDEDGWLHSGDLGKFDKDGYLYMTGRLKEIIITAGGENIPPVLIEEEIKKELPCIANCMLIGDKRKYLTILLTLKAEMNIETTEPLQELTTPCISWMKSKGCFSRTVRDSIQNVKSNPNGRLSVAIFQGINRYNSRAMSKAQKIQKWTILPHDFSVFTGELSSTLKLKRSVVLKKYSPQIEDMYVENNKSKL